jgi:hypothetical protein
VSTTCPPETGAAEAPTGGATVSECPYVGPRPFLASDSHRFFGRDRECIDLKHRILAHPITLLYSMSGAGKTSLINARLVPDFKADGHLVLPPARVRGSTGKLRPEEVPNIYVFQTLMSWQGEGGGQPLECLRNQTLIEALAPWAELAEVEDASVVAVFDQFVELLTSYSSRWRDRREFFEQLSQALEALSNLRVLLAMRENYLASLDPYASLVPENLRSKFRLERLRRDVALEALVKPLDGTGRQFAPGVAEKLLSSLMTIRVRPRKDVSRPHSENEDADLLAGGGGSPSSLELPASESSEGLEVTSEFVEPVQLQVVSQNLWSNLRPEEHEITAAHLARCGDVDQALTRFYESCIGEAVAATGLREGVVRRWFTERLITPAVTRGLILRGEETTGGLPNEAVELFESRQLVRGEDRGGARWYELSHDRFLEPVRRSNLAWLESIKSQGLWSHLGQRAAAWDAAPEAEKPSLLLGEVDLVRAENWRSSPDSDELGLSPQLQDLIKANRDALEDAAEHRDRQRMRRLIGGLSVGAVALATAVLFVYGLWLQARRAEALAESKRVEREGGEGGGRGQCLRGAQGQEPGHGRPARHEGRRGNPARLEDQVHAGGDESHSERFEQQRPDERTRR